MHAYVRQQVYTLFLRLVSTETIPRFISDGIKTVYSKCNTYVLSMDTEAQSSTLFKSVH